MSKANYKEYFPCINGYKMIVRFYEDGILEAWICDPLTNSYFKLDYSRAKTSELLNKIWANIVDWARNKERASSEHAEKLLEKMTSKDLTFS